MPTVYEQPCTNLHPTFQLLFSCLYERENECKITLSRRLSWNTNSNTTTASDNTNSTTASD